ncbi:MAG: hypothetical protein HY695_31765 [Deltaproteobacteria bacterium]|nr:hypothetical protein [Deltaproteobacteria bacterium]
MQRNTATIDKELSDLREQIRELEAAKDAATKTMEAAKNERKRSAYAAHASKDAKAAERLLKAREAAARASLEAEDIEAAVETAKTKYETLEREREEAYRIEKWQECMALAEEIHKDAQEMDSHIENLFVKLLQGHQEKIEHLRHLAQEAEHEGAFKTAGIRHVFRRINGKIVRFAPFEADKPSAVYLQSTYADIFQMQLDAAKREAKTEEQAA